jgi:hypothetical protein
MTGRAWDWATYRIGQAITWLLLPPRLPRVGPRTRDHGGHCRIVRSSTTRL